MHIPSIPSTQLEVIPFDKLIEESNTKRDDYDITKWLFVPPYYSEYRYILGTRGKNPLICVGINPSTARPNELDNTLRSVERIALGNNFDSFIMFNVYAQRATRPNDMDKVPNEALHGENMRAFEYILSHCESSPAIWAAWGNIIEMRSYLPACLLDMIEIGKKYNARWFSCGAVSKKGHPHHPLYLRRDLPLDPFDIVSYIELL